MNKDIVKSVLIYTAIGFLVLAIVLQFVYIHSQLQATRDSIMKKGLVAEAKAKQIGHNQNFLRIYPIIVDLKLGLHIRQQSSEFQEKLKEIMKNHVSILPYICDKSITQAQVTFTKIAILALDVNYGADSLYEDVKNDRTSYIILRDQLYGITVNEKINETIHEQFVKKKEEQMDSNQSSLPNYTKLLDDLQNRRVFTLIPLMNHEVVGTQENNDSMPSSNCRFRLTPFLGMLTAKTGTDFLINVNIEIASDETRANLTMHVIGYRTIN